MTTSLATVSTPLSPTQKGPLQVLPSHCPYRQADLLQEALAPDKMRVGFLLGAGCPVSIRVPAENGSTPLIPDIAGLTAQIHQAVEVAGTFKNALNKIFQRISDNGTTNPNIEDVLSHVRSLHQVIGPTSVIDGLNKVALQELDAEICLQAKELADRRLPSGHSPYHDLASWIRGMKREHAVEIFTTNYDLLMEQALEERRVPYFDGFVGSDRTFFDLASMEQDILPPRWARLWKLHGSVNWSQNQQGRVERRTQAKGDQLLIYPSHLKYEESRRMPYFAMQDRLRSFLSRGQAVLVTCGYSFSDRHVNDVVLQGLSGNPTAICIALLYADRVTAPSAISSAREHSNLSVLAADGAVIGTVERSWRSDEKRQHPLHGIAAQTGELQDRSSAAIDCCKFLLGDFASLGNFLAHQLLQVGDGKDARRGA